MFFISHEPDLFYYSYACSNMFVCSARILDYSDCQIHKYSSVNLSTGVSSFYAQTNLNMPYALVVVVFCKGQVERYSNRKRI